MKIGIIGFGAIGFDVAKKLDTETDKFNMSIADKSKKLKNR